MGILTKEDVINIFIKQKNGRTSDQYINSFRSEVYELMDFPLTMIKDYHPLSAQSKPDEPIVIDLPVINHKVVNHHRVRPFVPVPVVLTGLIEFKKAVNSGQKTIKAYVGNVLCEQVREFNLFSTLLNKLFRRKNEK